MPLSLIVHGGAWDVMSDERARASEHGCRRALFEGWKVLSTGGSAVDVVEAAICVMEDDPAFDAGRGAFLNADGVIELDASIMDGQDLNTGAVAAVQRMRHPITLARRVLESDWALLVGDGALRFAREVGLDECSQWDLVTQRELERWKGYAGEVLCHMDGGPVAQSLPSDTVGAVALDGRGNVASGTSTGGLPNKRPGRVGDSPLIGCGTYADSTLGGASTTGPGEQIVKVVLAKYAVDMLCEGASAQQASEAALAYLRQRVGSQAGITVVDRGGGIGCAFTTRHMSYAYMSEGQSEPVVGV